MIIISFFMKIIKKNWTLRYCCLVLRGVANQIIFRTINTNKDEIMMKVRVNLSWLTINCVISKILLKLNSLDIRTICFFF